ncbi:hypothetical protein C2S52_012637 [Perilla frutescens var. hirtella]|nr:hypothetical protein C2S52_012637 [Perilla frutescens var. hirtella]
MFHMYLRQCSLRRHPHFPWLELGIVHELLAKCRILLDISYEGDLTDLTPQKKLLSIIEALENMVMEELNHLKRTTGEKVGRQRRVRMLISFCRHLTYFSRYIISSIDVEDQTSNWLSTVSNNIGFLVS